ncbi:wall-associated receptor kinase-like 1 [Cynara cardunculus var. scolymus]|uniref:wall-associated receptor kinase-like 1 n=1 Tax=Cynara cardunculus var. scolymus TaxID=59895 RepID=UPI000D63130C|nr:wall-associated receptor kinase-like 1 [Cynara cardunculus var. scolymus]
MKHFQVLHLVLVVLVLLTTSFTEALSYAKRGCNDTCGEVSIPYPFGIGADCSINEWYNVDCTHSTPYLSAFNNMEVLWVNLQLQMVVINVPMIADRHNPVLNSSTILNTNHGDSPFLFCKLHNKLVVEGCGNAVIMQDGSIVSGCSSTCRNDTVSDINKCFGTGCCQTRIPHYLESFTLNLTCLESQGGYEVCRSALLMDDSLVIGKNFSLGSIPGNGASVPIGFLWTLTDRDYHELNGCSVHKSVRLTVGKESRVKSHKCKCGVGRYGNPYLEGGCEVPENCKGCEVNGGRCIYQITSTDGNEYTAFNCLTGTISGSNKISFGVVLGNLFSHLAIHTYIHNIYSKSAHGLG